MNREDFLEIKSHELILFHILRKKLEKVKVIKLFNLAKKLQIPGYKTWRHQNTFAQKIARKIASEWEVYNVFLCEI